MRVDWGDAVQGYPHVHRGSVQFQSQHEPLRIILKFPQKPDRWARLCNDWAGCRFLLSIPGGDKLGPHSFGGDSQLRFTLSQEVQGTTFTDILMTPSEPRNNGPQSIAWASLVKFGQTLGRLHSATHGRQSDYARIRRSIGPAEEHVNFDLSGRVRAQMDTILTFCRDWKVDVHDRLLAEISDVIRVIGDVEESRSWLTYTHLDLNPNNLIRTPEGNVRIIDFDSAAYRHALLDGVWCRMCFPTHWPTYALPPALLAGVETAYRLELSHAFLGAAVDDDNCFQAAVTDACAFWTLIRLSWVAEVAFEASPKPERVSHLRRQLIVALDRLVGTAEESGLRPGLRTMAEAMLAFIQDRWGDKASDLIHPFPALKSVQ